MFPARIPVQLQILPHGAELPRPEYQTPGASGFDLRAAIPEDEPVHLYPGDGALIPTGLAISVPAGYELQIRPRSGLAYQYGVIVLNSPGTIDSDYRGEIKVLLANLGNDAVAIEAGQRIAQAVLCPVLSAKFVEVESLDDTERGAGGFGSTGAS
jgi:dUTP pyrophosphatase